MTDQELFIWGLIAFILLMAGIALTIIEFNKLGKTLQNNTERDQ